MRVLHIIAAACVALICAFAPAHAEKRIALVIGNNRYDHLPDHEQLRKAVNDAHAVGGALKEIGFDVITGENLGRQGMIDRLDEAARRVSSGDTVFFFFAGHGVAVGGVNYILPADVPDVETGQVTRLTGAALREDDITAALMGAGVRVAVVVLDACRDNPFGAGTRGVGGERGLAPRDPPSGVFTLYSAGRGQSALDRLSDDDSNPNSVFTRVLVPALAKPGDLASLAIRVREDVARIAAAAGHTQRPAYYDETVGGAVYLNGPPPAGGQTAITPPPVSDAERTWSLIQNTPSLKALDDFIAQYGNVPIYGPLAKARREEVAKGRVAVVVPTSPPPVVSPQPQRDAPLTPDRERGLHRGDTFRECEKCPEMVVVPSGSFMMGSPDSEKGRVSEEGPQHTVTISRPFAVGKFHVTRDEFAVFATETRFSAHSKCDWRNPGFAQDGSHPVVCITRDDANAYANWLVAKTGKNYRLPSEAEFEYAARAGTTTPYWWGSSITPLQARYGAMSTVPDTSFAANPWGLYNVHGNAWQWTADCWHGNYKNAPSDGTPWATGDCSARAVRGGSYFVYSQFLRAAYRDKLTDAANLVPNGNNLVGFRLARTLTP